MKKVCARWLIVCLIMVAAAPAFALAGKYAVKGTNPGGKGSYNGMVTITQKGELYQLQWSVGTSYAGVGIKNGNILSVGWGHPNKPGYGIVTYTVGADGALTGSWATADAGGVGTETLTPQK